MANTLTRMERDGLITRVADPCAPTYAAPRPHRAESCWPIVSWTGGRRLGGVELVEHGQVVDVDSSGLVPGVEQALCLDGDAWDVPAGQGADGEEGPWEQVEAAGEGGLAGAAVLVDEQRV